LISQKHTLYFCRYSST